ncbi:hypothetical protein F5148DRAFT_1304849 [Russula earlei]|uniref:Uncharacterized protein n=1 Tax=Russula earlei TaxID=71964 RepID=A0ACC0U8I1_9AGAM|nr:hypothetical protein F5148DRAFT_1304849 [Russula earlei]
MAPRRKCNVCGSQQWKKEPATGLLVCGEGHVLQNYLEETYEAHGLGARQGHKRALKSTRESRGRTTKANPELYHGARAEYLRFQCLQLLLRKQVAALIQLWKLPTEFEIICRDLWALHLSLLPSPPPPEPLLHKQATQVHVESHDPEAIGTHGENRGRPGASSPKGDDVEGDLELEALLWELSQSGSSEDDKDDDTRQPRPNPDGSEVKPFGRTGPANNIALLMVACWTLRVPVMYLDLIRLIESYKLPYLEPLHHLPAGMARHLTKHNVQALSPRHAPTTQVLHSISARLARKLLESYKIHTPEMNAAPMLWRVVRALGGGPVLYSLSKTVAHVLSLPLALHHTLVPRLAKLKDEDPDSHKFDDIPPELALLVTVIIVLKMVYGFDGQPRVVKNSADPACALPRLEDYLMIFREVKEAHTRCREVLFSASSKTSVLDLDGPMLDEYLDLCQRGLLRPETLRSDQRTLEEFFPLEPGRIDTSNGLTAMERPQGDQHVLRAGLPKEGRREGEREPGEGYAVYSTRDVLGVLPEEMELVVSYGARWVGVDEEFILKVSEAYERRLLKWWAGLRKSEGSEGRRRTF